MNSKTGSLEVFESRHILVRARAHTEFKVPWFKGKISNERIIKEDLNKRICKQVIHHSARACALRRHIHGVSGELEGFDAGSDIDMNAGRFGRCPGEPPLLGVMCLTLKAAAADCRPFHRLNKQTSHQKLQSRSTRRHDMKINCVLFLSYAWNPGYLPFSLSTYRLWHSFSILSLGVVIADSRGFATDRGFLPDIVNRVANSHSAVYEKGKTFGVAQAHTYTRGRSATSWSNTDRTGILQYCWNIECSCHLHPDLIICSYKIGIFLSFLIS